MKMKIFAVITIILLVVTSLNVLAVSSDSKPQVEVFVKNDSMFFSNVEFQTTEDYISVKLEEADSYLSETGKPMLPVVIKTFSFPLGTKIKSVSCEPLEIIESSISEKIKPAPKVFRKANVDTTVSNLSIEQTIEDKNVYSSSVLYPDKWYDYNINVGLKDDENVVILTISYYPVRYSPGNNLLYEINEADVKILYEESLQTHETAEVYDLVIIAPDYFSQRLEPLKEHKTNMGLKTFIKTTESIYSEARQGKYGLTGRDRAEKIKLFIHWAKENWDVKYVLLFGGKKTQSLLRWHVPVRYSHLDDEPWDDPNWETSYLSDLYFADIYKYNTDEERYEFDDWDSNKNSVFAEWTFKIIYTKTEEGLLIESVLDKKDTLDLYPDVYVGRLPCRNQFEVTTVVDKIIAYETSKNNSEWFNNFMLVGGDSFPPDDGGHTGYYEGEIITDVSASYMTKLGFNITRLWVSNGNFTGPSDLINAINEGAGFIHLSGHGNPLDWGTHPADATEPVWVDGLINPDMRFLNNSDMLPVVVVGGCHNSQFDVSLMNFLVGFLRYRLRYFFVNENRDCFAKGEWYPRSWSWNLIRQQQGGAIAVIGNTGLGWESLNEYCTSDLTGWLEPRFFKVYSETDKNNQTLGRIHSQAISEFVTSFSPNEKSDTKIRKTVEQWALLGDPSLKLGGYYQD